MSLVAGIAVLLLSLLLLHALVAPVLHGLAVWLYRGSPPARADAGRARAAFLLLAASPLVVLVLGVSGMGHLAEGGGAWAGLLAACHQFHEHCDLLLASPGAELPIYGALLALVGGWLGLALWRTAQPLLAVRRLEREPASGARAERLRTARGLAAPGVPVDLVRGVRGLAVTVGFLRPRILVSSDLVDALEPGQLAAVLAHEAAHVRGRDALRTLALRFASSLSPHALFTRRAERAYELDREILCDAEAVRRGADPLALAAALVSVAKLRVQPIGLPAAVGTHDIDRAVRTRVQLLLADSPEHHAPDSQRRTVAAAVLVTLAASALPHAAFGLVVSVHCGVESLVHLLA